MIGVHARRQHRLQLGQLRLDAVGDGHGVRVGLLLDREDDARLTVEADDSSSARPPCP